MATQAEILRRLSVLEEAHKQHTTYSYLDEEEHTSTPTRWHRPLVPPSTCTTEALAVPLTSTPLIPPPSNAFVPPPSTPILPHAPPSAPQTDTLPTSVATSSSPIIHEPFPAKPPSSTKALPSSEINRTKLLPINEALSRYSTLIYGSKVRTLATKLAKECIFGDDVLVRCTVAGSRCFPALPVAELNELKKIVYIPAVSSVLELTSGV